MLTLRKLKHSSRDEDLRRWRSLHTQHMASFISSTQRGIRRCLASGWSDTGSVLSVEASTLKSADLQRK